MRNSSAWAFDTWRNRLDADRKLLQAGKKTKGGGWGYTRGKVQYLNTSQMPLLGKKKFRPSYFFLASVSKDGPEHIRSNTSALPFASLASRSMVHQCRSWKGERSIIPQITDYRLRPQAFYALPPKEATQRSIDFSLPRVDVQYAQATVQNPGAPSLKGKCPDFFNFLGGSQNFYPPLLLRKSISTAPYSRSTSDPLLLVPCLAFHPGIPRGTGTRCLPPSDLYSGLLAQ